MRLGHDRMDPLASLKGKKSVRADPLGTRTDAAKLASGDPQATRTGDDRMERTHD